jgi:hypothetical protein
MATVLTVLLLVAVVAFIFAFKVPFMAALWEALRESWKGIRML